MISVCYKGKCYKEIQLVEEALFSEGVRLVYNDKEYPTTGDVIVIGSYGKIPASRPIRENGRKLYRLPMLAPPYTDEHISTMREFTRSLFICKMFMTTGKYYQVDCGARVAMTVDDVIFALDCSDPDDILSYDIETTGLHPEYDKVITASFYSIKHDHVFTCHFDERELGLDKMFEAIISCKSQILACNCKFEQKWMIDRIGSTRVMLDIMVDDCLLNETTNHGLELLAGYANSFGYELPMEDFLVPIIKTASANKNQRFLHCEAPIWMIEHYNQDDAIVTGRALANTTRALKAEPSNQDFVRSMLNRGQVVLANMEHRGMYVDAEVAMQVRVEYERKVATMINTIREEAEKHGMADFNPASSQQRSKLLYEKLGLPVLRLTNDKWIPQDDYFKDWWVGKGFPSTDATTMDMLLDVVDNPIVKVMTDVASVQVLLDGIIKRCNTAVTEGDGFMRTDFSATKLVTGQLSSTNPPMQNVPKDPIRRMFKSRFSGGVIIEADYSQLHLRIIGNLANCDGFISAYLDDVDLHARTAAMVVAREPEEVFLKKLAKGDSTAEINRDTAKRTNFAIIFEIGAKALATKVKRPEAECKKIIARWFETFPEIKEQIERQHRFAEEHGYVLSPFGRVRHLPYAKQNRDRYAKLRAFRQAGDYLISNSGRYITYYGMIMLDEYMRAHRMKSVLTLQIHDSVILDAHPSEIDDCKELIKKFCVDEVSKHCAEWMDPIPLKMDGVCANRWWKNEPDAKKFTF